MQRSTIPSERGTHKHRDCCLLWLAIPWARPASVFVQVLTQATGQLFTHVCHHEVMSQLEHTLSPVMTPVPICSIRVGMVAIAAGKAKIMCSCTAARAQGTAGTAEREDKKQVSSGRSGSLLYTMGKQQESRFSESHFGAACKRGLSVRRHRDLPNVAEHTWCLSGAIRGLLYGWGVLGGGGQQTTLCQARRFVSVTRMPIITNPTTLAAIG